MLGIDQPHDTLQIGTIPITAGASFVRLPAYRSCPVLLWYYPLIKKKLFVVVDVGHHLTVTFLYETVMMATRSFVPSSFFPAQ
jgi:hypothetical protein